MKRVPAIRQHDASDCGVACLSSIARFHGRAASMARVRQYANTDRAGTSLLGLRQAAERLGYSAKGVRATPEALVRAPVPAIAHLRLVDGAQHYVVVERADERRVWIMDPAHGERRVDRRADFDPRWTGALLLLSPADRFEPLPPAASLGQRLRCLVAPHGRALAQALVGALVYTLLGLATSIYVRQLVDSVLATGRAGPLHVMTVAMIGIIVAQTVIGAARTALMVHVGQHIDAVLILGYVNHLLALPQRVFDGMRVGDLTSRVTDAVKVRAFVGDVVVDAAANVLIVITATAMMFTYDWRLAACTIVALPLYAVLYAIGTRISRTQQRTVMERAAALEAQLVESLGAMGTIKRFGLERHAALLTEMRFVQLFRTLGEAARTGIWIGGAGQLVSRLSTVALLWIGAARALEGRLSAGELMSCYALLGFLTNPMLSLLGFGRAVQEARAAGERLFELMDLEPEARETPVPLSRERVGDVVLEGVHFRYGARSAALVDVSLTCPAGRVTAIVGESGSGKSTIAALVERIYPVDAGRILIGAQDIAHVTLGSLRALVGVVPQAIDLFTGTIIDNVALDEPSPDVARIVALCGEVGLREVVERMPLGWLTPLGERGVGLSGGERQRLALVRALYRRPAVLILDEATSALDSANEQRVLELIRRVADAGTTVIVIAHQATAMRIADHTVVLERGRVRAPEAQQPASAMA